MIHNDILSNLFLVHFSRRVNSQCLSLGVVTIDFIRQVNTSNSTAVERVPLLGLNSSFEVIGDWELNLVTVVELEASVHHKAIVVREEEAPGAVRPAGEETAGGRNVDEPVPEVGDDVFKESHNQIIKYHLQRE